MINDKIFFPVAINNIIDDLNMLNNFDRPLDKTILHIIVVYLSNILLENDNEELTYTMVIDSYNDIFGDYIDFRNDEDIEFIVDYLKELEIPSVNNSHITIDNVEKMFKDVRYSQPIIDESNMHKKVIDIEGSNALKNYIATMYADYIIKSGIYC